MRWENLVEHATMNQKPDGRLQMVFLAVKFFVYRFWNFYADALQ